MNAPLYLARSGYINDGSIYSREAGYYWSSTIYDLEFSYGLGFSSSNVVPSGHYVQYRGHSLRCVLRES